MFRRLLRRKPKALLAMSIVFIFMLTAFQAATLPNSAFALSSSEETALAQLYAPTLQFSKSERTYPCDVDFYISRCNLNLTSGTTFSVVRTAGSFTGAQLGSYALSTYYLDNTVGTNHDDRIINDYKDNSAKWTYTVYYHVGTSGSATYIQYWIFYVFNEGTFNDHEGDWEMVQVVLDSDHDPTGVDLSQHNNGVSAAWSDADHTGNSIVSYVAKGSHANYLKSWQGSLGMAQDVVDSGGKRLSPTDYSLVRLDDSLGWTRFGGVWGNWGSAVDSFLGQRGPPGPEFRTSDTGESMWNGVTWAGSIAPLNKGMLTLELIYSYFWLIYIMLLAIPVAFLSFRLYKKWKRHELKRPYNELANVTRPNLRTFANILAIVGLVIGVVSAFFPYYVASVNVQSGTINTHGFVDVISIDGLGGIFFRRAEPKEAA